MLTWAEHRTGYRTNHSNHSKEAGDGSHPAAKGHKIHANSLQDATCLRVVPANSDPIHLVATPECKSTDGEQAPYWGEVEDQACPLLSLKGAHRSL